MNNIDIARRSLRSLLSAKTRTFLTALAIAVGAFALTLTLGASNGANNYADVIIRDNFDPTELIVTRDATLFRGPDMSMPQVYNPNFGSITTANGITKQVDMLNDNDIARLKRVQGVASVEPEDSLSLQYVTRDGQKKYVATVIAYDSYRNPSLLAGNIPTQLPYRSVILPEGFVSALGFNSPKDALGKTIRLAVKEQQDQSSLLSSFLSGKKATLSTQDASSSASMEEEFNVIAVRKTPSTLISEQTGLYLYINTTDLTQLTDYSTQKTTNYHKYLSVYARVTDGNNTAKLNATQAKIKQLGYGAQSVLDTEKTITQVISVIQGIVLVFGIIAIIASLFGVINTMYISVLQRTREIGLMKALGMHKKDIYKLFLFEAGFIGLLGGVIGTVIAVIVGTFLNPVISNRLNLGNVQLLDFKYLQLLLLIIVLTVVAVIAGLLPAQKASTLDPIEALRTE